MRELIFGIYRVLPEQNRVRILVSLRVSPTDLFLRSSTLRSAALLTTDTV